MLKIRVILVCPLEICWNLFLGQIRELSAGQTLEIDLSKKELIILGQADKTGNAFVEDRITIFLKISFYRLNRHLQKKFNAFKN